MELAYWLTYAWTWQTMLLLMSHWQRVVTWAFLTASGLALQSPLCLGSRGREDIGGHGSPSHAPFQCRCSSESSHYNWLGRQPSSLLGVIPVVRSALKDSECLSAYYVTDVFKHRTTSNCKRVLEISAGRVLLLHPIVPFCTFLCCAVYNASRLRISSSFGCMGKI